jgi:hypothetical protein
MLTPWSADPKAGQGRDTPDRTFEGEQASRTTTSGPGLAHTQQSFVHAMDHGWVCVSHGEVLIEPAA